MIIAGAVGDAPTSYLQSLTDKLLDEQKIYGAGSRAIVAPPGAALGAGHVPGTHPNLAKSDGWVLLADARLDNPDELEERVGGLAGRSNADLLLALWLREGENCLARIAGDFAMAIFNSRTRSLSLARDVTGQRPLFYTQTAFGFAFGSMAAGLRPAFLNFSVNRRSLALLAMDAPIDSGESFFDGVSSVGQAEVVRFSSSGRLTRKYYWAVPSERPDNGDRKALIEEYRHVLDQAVRPRLGGASTVVATHLSGGFDSSSVAATAVRLRGNPLAVVGTSAPAFATPPEAKFGFFAEESELAAEVAAMYGFRHVVVRDTGPIPEVFRSQTALLQQPVRDPFNGAWWMEIEARASAMGATRLLTGELGNLTINAGNQTHLSERSGAAGGVPGSIRHERLPAALTSNGGASSTILSNHGSRARHRRPWKRLFLHQRPCNELSFVRREWQHLGKHQRRQTLRQASRNHSQGPISERAQGRACQHRHRGERSVQRPPADRIRISDTLLTNSTGMASSARCMRTHSPTGFRRHCSRSSDAACNPAIRRSASARRMPSVARGNFVQSRCS